MSTDTWNRLTGRNDYPPGGHLGAKYWDGSIAALTAHHHRVFAPTLTDEQHSTLAGHIEQICALITEHDLKDVILVGHSYGGMVITGVADRVRDKIRRLVYLDAALPDPGQSLWAPPVTPFAIAAAASAKRRFCGGIRRLAESAYNRFPILVSYRRFPYIELPSSHVPMADMPERFYQLLLDVAEQ